MKRYFIFLLVVLMLISSFGCSKNAGQNGTSEDETKTVESADVPDDVKADKLLSELPDTDYEGREFRIATDDSSYILPPNGSNYVGKKVYARINAVEKKYNVKIVLTDESDMPSIAERVRMEAMAGSDYCDLAVLKASSCQQLIVEGALQSVTNIPYVSTNTKGVYQDATNAMTLGSNVYGLCGDFCYDADSMFVVFFNKSLAEKTGLPDLYQLVNDNQWDFANFKLYTEEAYSLKNVNARKVYGFTSTESTETLIQAFWASSDLQYLDNPYGGQPTLVYDKNSIRGGFVDQIQKLLYKNVAYLNSPAGALDAFCDGQMLFLIAPLKTAADFFSGQTDWGVLPMPVYDINQATHRTYQKLDYQIACFPNGIGDVSFAGEITQALFVVAEKTSAEYALSEYLNLYLRSPQDGLMLKKILDTPYFDPAAFFSPIYSEYYAATQSLIQRVVAGSNEYAKLYSQFSAAFDKFVKSKVS